MTKQIAGLEKLLASDNPHGRTGSVWLVGAGPGDVELLTVKALRLIEQAEVVVYDRLVSQDILDRVPPGALGIDVGKSPGFHGLKQSQINQLLVDLAAAGQQVIRLKGGDPFVFGRGGEEMAWVQQAGIACHIVPGITAATGCAAATGIPLTHREMAQSVRFVTGHGKEGKPQLDWQSMKDHRQTLVFYMGLTWCTALSQQLVAFGRDAHTPVAIIERGTRADQRVMITTLQQLATTVEKEKPQSPALLIVGDVVRFYRGNMENGATAAYQTSGVAEPLL